MCIELHRTAMRLVLYNLNYLRFRLIIDWWKYELAFRSSSSELLLGNFTLKFCIEIMQTHWVVFRRTNCDQLEHRIRTCFTSSPADLLRPVRLYSQRSDRRSHRFESINGNKFKTNHRLSTNNNLFHLYNVFKTAALFARILRKNPKVLSFCGNCRLQTGNEVFRKTFLL